MTVIVLFFMQVWCLLMEKGHLAKSSGYKNINLIIFTYLKKKREKRDNRNSDILLAFIPAAVSLTSHL